MMNLVEELRAHIEKIKESGFPFKDPEKRTFTGEFSPAQPIPKRILLQAKNAQKRGKKFATHAKYGKGFNEYYFSSSEKEAKETADTLDYDIVRIIPINDFIKKETFE